MSMYFNLKLETSCVIISASFRLESMFFNLRLKTYYVKNNCLFEIIMYPSNSVIAIIIKISFIVHIWTMSCRKCKSLCHCFGSKYRGSPPYTFFGTWKKPCYMKLVLVGLYCGPLLTLIPPLTRT